MGETVSGAFGELAALLQRSAVAHAATIEQIATRFTETLRSGGTLYFGGNGGSAADAQHCAAEYVVRYSHRHADRPAYAAVALGTDVAMLTAASNDLGFERAYARQVEALVTKRDLLILHSTSGRSPNLLAAAQAARAKGATVIALLGRDGGPLKALADMALVVDHDDTGRIQLVHMAVQHVIVGMVESRLERNGLMIDFSNRTVFITGGSRGVGRAAALLFARTGADVAISYHTRRDAAEEVTAEIRTLGRRAVAVGGDHADEAVVGRMYAEITAALGGLDIFVANAGIWPERDVPLEEMPAARWAETLRANLDGVYLTTRAALQVMRPGGSVVLVSSTAGQRGEAFHADYAVTKGGLLALTKSLAIECAPGITVNCCAPGWIDTDMSAGVLTPEYRAKVESSIPLGRIATADDVAWPILFLASPLARHITGEILNVNGGSVLCG